MSAAPLREIDLQISQGQAVLGLLERSLVPPLPAFYQLFYDYVAGVKSLISSRLDSILSHSAAAPEETRDVLYSEFISPYVSHEDLAAVIARMTSRLAVLDALMRESQSANAAQAKSLAAARLQLDQPGIEKALLAELVQRMRDTTEVLRRANVSLSDQLAAAFDELDETREELRKSGEKARMDPLTGVLNLTGIDVTLSQLMADAPKNGRSFSLAIVDIDHFKSLNDGYGHQVGDQVLKIAARLLLATARGNDIVGRVGGDEFVLIMPDMGAEMAQSVAERVCRSVREHDLSPILGKDVLGGMTVSIGIAAYHDGDSIGALFERADQALYRAKDSGRNRVVRA